MFNLIYISVAVTDVERGKMGLLKKYFKPDIYLENIASLDVDELFKIGIRMLLVDLDNTLSAHGSVNPDEFAFKQIKRVEASGIKCIIFSNAMGSRAKEFSENIGIDCITTPAKPTKRGIRKFFAKYPEYKRKEVAIIGDQIFTDVLTGKRSKIYTILVNPLFDEETGQVKFKRIIEDKLKSSIGISTKFIK